MQERLYRMLDKTRTLEKYIIMVLIGIALYLFVYGLLPLDVTNDMWIYSGYAGEADIIQHYSSWMLYRNSEWGWPIGKIVSLSGEECSTYISYTDSIPLLAIPFKLIRNFLPDTFQYFGWYILGCFILQSVFCGKIAGIFTQRREIIYPACFLFTLSPTLLERSFRHTALASHWLILAALYLYFKRKKSNKVTDIWVKYTLLSILCVLIHPYFLPMVLGILFAALIEIVVANRKDIFGYLRAIAILFINVSGAALCGYVIGLFGMSDIIAKNQDMGGGYGFFSMNLNAVINPISHGYGCFGLGNSKWSVLLPAQSQTLGNYDGFNYLGLGILISSLTIGMLVCLVKEWRIMLWRKLKDNWGLAVLMLFFVIYAVSNVVTLGDKELFSYSVPRFLWPIFSTFKASSRYFYPVLYMIDIITVYFWGKLVKNKNCAILITIVIIQMIDFSEVICEKHYALTSKYVSADYETRCRLLEEWENAAIGYEKALLLDPVPDPAEMYWIAYAAGKTNIQNNFYIMNRGSIQALQRNTDLQVQSAIMNGAESGTMYLFLNPNYAKAFQLCMGEDYGIKEINNYWQSFWWVYKIQDSNHITGNIDNVSWSDLTLLPDSDVNIEITPESESVHRISGWVTVGGSESSDDVIILEIKTESGQSMYIPIGCIGKEPIDNSEFVNLWFEVYSDYDFETTSLALYCK